MPDTLLEVTFDGLNDVPRLPTDTPQSFSSRFMGYYSVFEPDAANRLVADIDFAGSDWTVATMRFGDASTKNLTRITDTDDGANRRIDWLSLGYNSEVDLTTTRVRQLTGWDGDKHEVQLGSGSTWSVALFAKVNIVKTGDGHVNSIVTGGKDTIYVSDFGADLVSTGDGNAKVTTKGYVQLIKTGDGKDLVNIGSNGAGLVKTGDGNDKIKLSEMPDGAVAVEGSNGVDTLDFGKFGTGVTFDLNQSGRWRNVANPDETPGLPNLGWVSATSIENLTGSNKNDTLIGNWDKNKLVGKSGNDILDGGDNNDVLLGGGGNDTLIGGRGNDTLKGQAGADVFEFGPDSGIDRVIDYVDGTDKIRLVGHSGGFDTVSISKVGRDLHVQHDGGTIVMVGDGGVKLTDADFLFA